MPIDNTRITRFLALNTFLVIFWTFNALGSTPFPMPEALRPQVKFWIKMFTKYPSSHMLIFDEDDVRIVYHVVDTQTIKGPTDVYIRNTIQDLKNTIQSVIKKNFYELTESEITFLEKVPRPRTVPKLKRMLRTIRFQQGGADSFRQGLVRSGYYLPMIRTTLKKHNVPLELAYLPHVESAFDPAATSKYGAAGLWQFTQSTGKHYLNISYAVDERRDPELSSIAAAKLLSENYQSLKTWPLAITAYNHGRTGVNRLVNRLGSRKIKDILNHKGGNFLFASRNFYPSFLAAKYIASHINYFFPGLKRANPLTYQSFIVSKNTLITQLVTPELPIQTLKRLNPSFSSPLLQGYRSIPAGTRINLPKSQKIPLLAKTK
jgi:membrane-bound lytic murein transglycosylase D